MVLDPLGQPGYSSIHDAAIDVECLTTSVRKDDQPIAQALFQLGVKVGMYLDDWLVPASTPQLRQTLAGWSFWAVSPNPISARLRS